MEELKQIYRQAVTGRIRELEAALAALDAAPAESCESVRRVAHALRGSGGTYGFPAVSAAAAAVEEATPGQLVTETERLLAVLREVAGARAVTRILAVDDDPEIQLLLRYTLSGGGNDVVFAGSAAEAESLLAAGRFDLVLLDLVLPDADGRVLLRRIREQPAHAATPVIVLSGRDGAAVRAECLALGASACLAKPFDPDALVSAVRAQLHAGR